MAVRRVLCAAIVVALAGCNPLLTDPVDLGGGIEDAAVRYDGPAGAWLEAVVRPTPDHAVYAMAIVLDGDRTGPVARACSISGDTVVPCVDTGTDVRMPNQRLMPDGGPPQRLMTVWPGETVHVVLVCVHEATQELVCPPDLLTAVQARDEQGALVGELEPSEPL